MDEPNRLPIFPRIGCEHEHTGDPGCGLERRGRGWTCVDGRACGRHFDDPEVVARINEYDAKMRLAGPARPGRNELGALMAANRWELIPQLPASHYEVDVIWHYLERELAWLGSGLNLDPDYQRAHVWTEAQQVAYVEYVLMGGEVSKSITWNAVEWPAVGAPVELVDGKQRLEAARKFIRGDLEVFGMRYRKGDSLSIKSGFKFRICSLERADVLRLYLNINAGGTPHTAEEIERVRGMLATEQAKG